ncbi:embryonic polarity protein dorsal isoform X1 [Chelonus insularis]|uniref:embryonic polarity protein dorsal isoform X1 n=1 Tax=Chelonus insularis TaxID=460826 RepID=UPI0015892AB0|nr:embryonic polarity protein dorsal isoform X1 [Chelonus insularis]XP_034950476.1 embryonic polarity protein dorsal isoform X1 [Chelonus insularis]
MDQYHDMNDNINISDVIEVIQTTDPEFVEGTRCQNQALNMLSGGGVETIKPVAVNTGRVGPYVEIVEQPASKALRFRYECEGRSAGSIPGVNSTPENKTFPSIRIVGYKGRAVVVVSCVTKDSPYRPHPHNLVGKEACRKGVCTVEISSENMTVTFANLGIQCVKKKDIEEALRIREDIRVDPFRTGFDHKRQPASIDLNSVRLCFQVFLEGTEKGKFTVPLSPVVSDPIYDKKAMSDLVICKLSHYSASVAGGMEMILLCEKVAKEDIQVRFFEERDGQVVWEGFGDFQPSHVHKQVAIAFRTPTYRIQQVDQPVQVYIQLKRPSDNATSDALPFQMLPLGSGRPAFWSLRKALNKKKADPHTFNKIIATEAAMLSNSNQKFTRNIDEYNNNNDLNINVARDKISALRVLNELYQVKNVTGTQNVGDILKTNHSESNNVLKNINNEGISQEKPENAQDNLRNVSMNDFSTPKMNLEIENANNPDVQTLPKDRTDWFDYSEVGKWVQKNQECFNDGKMTNVELKNEEDENKSFDDLLTQVAELDQIYADTHTKMFQENLEDPNKTFMDIDVCDNQTYTSLQMAMKNPIKFLDDIQDERKYEDVAIPSRETSAPPLPPPPLTAKRDVTRAYEEKMPPLPPKRIRKMSSMPVLPRSSSIQAVNTAENISEAPNKNLPSLPGTLTKSPKQSLFSKLFAKKNKKDKDLSLEGLKNSDVSLNNRNSISSMKNELPDYPDNSELPRPSVASIASVKSFDLNGDESPPYGIELTEAEHYALYTSMAPHATASEFDELSFYYSPVEGGKILTETK